MPNNQDLLSRFHELFLDYVETWEDDNNVRCTKLKRVTGGFEFWSVDQTTHTNKDGEEQVMYHHEPLLTIRLLIDSWGTAQVWMNPRCYPYVGNTRIDPDPPPWYIRNLCWTLLNAHIALQWKMMQNSLWSNLHMNSRDDLGFWFDELKDLGFC